MKIMIFMNDYQKSYSLNIFLRNMPLFLKKLKIWMSNICILVTPPPNMNNTQLSKILSELNQPGEYL